jgi:hypothetical protein
MADMYLTDRTQRRTVAGAQLNPAGFGVGRCALLFPMAASSIQSPSAADCEQDSLLDPS